MIDPATLRMMDPNLLSNPSALLAFQQMFQSHGGHGQGGQRPAGMSPTYEPPGSPFYHFAGSRTGRLQLKLDAFQDRFTKNGAQLQPLTQKLIGGVRWWNSLTNNAPERLRKPSLDDEDGSEQSEGSARPSAPPSGPSGPSGDAFSGPTPQPSPQPSPPRIAGPNYPGPDAWTRPPMPSSPGGSPFGGGIPSRASLGLRDAGAMTAPAGRASGGSRAPLGGDGASADEPEQQNEMLDAVRKLTEEIRKLTDTLSGKGQRESVARPGKPFMRGNLISPPRAGTPRSPENGELAEPHL